MRILVTGAAGFIGSHLCERLLQERSHEVIGVDAFVPTTPRWIKERNLSSLVKQPGFFLVEQDLLHLSWEKHLEGIDVVYHLAAIPGVRSSWGGNFPDYVSNNIVATQRLLEAVKDIAPQKFIYISTSSVYGEKWGQIDESASTEPLSPYGVSKLTGEHLCRIYRANYGIPVVILRYFTVYGPRQRPDMAFHRFIRKVFEGKPIPVFGDGMQSRDFTYVTDCVEATYSVMNAENVIGETINIGGTERATVLESISILEQLFGYPIPIDKKTEARGEPKHTWADISKAERLLGYRPKVSLREGLRLEIKDLSRLYRTDHRSLPDP
ncbi:NAD-dependent epimerase/dehydratase family protein [Thermicanus aegyptius]|uniref:NAD-dependent epimerase/dehydratase family protein n=1 Tax=Thermicanus aegyptius TaxID=94009 RepID=UPI00041F632B|nr:NAD-dependent epimerase/dehydratase family protein [Thermicanus aegyptius]